MLTLEKLALLSVSGFRLARGVQKRRSVPDGAVMPGAVVSTDPGFVDDSADDERVPDWLFKEPDLDVAVVAVVADVSAQAFSANGNDITSIITRICIGHRRPGDRR